MNSLRCLLRVQLLGAFGIGRLLNEREPKARRKLVMAAVGVALLALLAAGYAWAVGSVLAAVGAAGALPALAVAVSGAGCVFSTFAKANGLLFGFKDFDLVVTMPVPLWAVVVSRVAPLYGMGLVLSLLVGGPLMAVYVATVGAGPANVVVAVLVLALAPAVPVAASVALSFLAAWAVSHLPNANRALGVAGVVVAVAIVVAVTAASGWTDTQALGDMQALAAVGSRAEAAVAACWPPAAWASSALQGDAASLAQYAALSVVVCAVLVAVLSRFLIPLNSLLAAGGSRRAARAKAGTAHAPFAALVSKEIRLWVSTPVYLTNTAVGPVLALVAAIAAAVAGPQALASAVNVPGADRDLLMQLMAAEFPWVLAFCMAMTSLTSASMSLEGGARWIAQTAPVPASVLVGSKIAANAIVVVPTSLVAGAIAACSLAGGPLDVALMVVAPLAGGSLASCLGALLDARRPHFDWASAYEPVKRSANVVVCIGVGLVAVAAGAAVTLVLGSMAGLVAAAGIGAASFGIGSAALRVPMRDR